LNPASLGRVLAQRRVVGVLGLTFLACNIGFFWRTRTVGATLLDGRRWYRPADVDLLFRSLSADHRRLYAITELTLDVAYPIAYTGLFLAAIHWLQPDARRRLLVPLVAFAADLTENMLIAFLAWTWTPSNGAVWWVARAAAVATLTKWTAVCAALFVVVDGVIQRGSRDPPTIASDGYARKIADVVERELDYVRQRRRHARVGPVDPRDTLIGLSLSGGGIRSATTCLGILQALSRMGILPLVDYISTVSGGGYIGSCLTSLLTLPKPYPQGEGPIFSTEWSSFPFNPTHHEGRAQMDHLRTHGTFLVARSGLLARETMRSLGYLVSGTLYHLAIALLAMLTVALIYMGIVLKLSPDLHDTLRQVAPNQFIRVDPAYAAASPGAAERNVYRYPTLTERIRHKAALLRDAAWRAGNTTYGRIAVAAAVIFGALLAIVAFAYLVTNYRNPGRPLFGESERDARERALLRRVGGDGAAAVVGLFVISWWNCPAYAGVLWLFIPPLALLSTGVTNFGLHVLLPRFPDLWNRSVRSLWGTFEAMTAYAFWVAILLALFPLATYTIIEYWRGVSISGFGALAIARLLTTRRQPRDESRWTMPPAVRNFLLAVSIGTGVLLVLVAITALVVPRDADVLTAVFRFACASALGVWFFVVLGWLVDANRVSPHYFYQDRLGETYLYTEERLADGTLARGRNSMQMRLTDLHGRAPGVDDPTRTGTAPYHLISAAINLAGSRDLTRKDRKSGYFLFSKYYCGSVHTGFLPTSVYQQGTTRLARAMTVSGAAASSSIGMGTFFAQAFASVLFNVRLGYWMPNPSKAVAHEDEADRWFFWPRWLAREIFMRTHERAALVNISDGGHTGDNVGIYPLLQRRCRVIVACDAERDAALTFGSITEALRHAYIDLGIDVDIDFTMLRPDPETGLSRSHCAVGLIKYPPLSRFGRQDELPKMTDPNPPDDQEMVGYLIYLKSSLTGDEPEPVLNYKATHKPFPHESTVDQFFDDSQFESYRALGVHIAEESLGPWVTDRTFLAFREAYWPLP